MTVHLIRTEADHQRAIARISTLMSARPGTPEFDELDALATLVEAYENKTLPMDPPDPIAAIEFRMDQQGLTRKDLEPILGSRARVSEVMNGRRPLTLAMIRRLHDELGIAADILIARPKLKRQKASASKQRKPVRGRKATAASRRAA
jgi:HTH-type transcriptional regulator/antitoxin HigA